MNWCLHLVIIHAGIIISGPIVVFLVFNPGTLHIAGDEVDCVNMTMSTCVFAAIGQVLPNQTGCRPVILEFGQEWVRLAGLSRMNIMGLGPR